VNEVPVTFGSEGHLAGTLTLPSGPARDMGVLLCNAGVIHRIGPHRINVKLARHLAAQGFTVLRMDLSGQGDSRMSASNLSFDRQAVADLRAGMDHASRATGVSRFALAGICSGANHGVAAALDDERLQALWLMDGYAYETPRTYRIRMALQLRIDPLRTIPRWLAAPWRIATGRVARLRAAVAGDGQLLEDGSHPTPPKAVYAGMLERLVNRGVALRLLYTGSMFWRYNHDSQWRDAFAAHSTVARLRCDLLRDVDHTVTTRRAQRIVIDSVSEFLTSPHEP
jgi:hypothetical protein